MDDDHDSYKKLVLFQGLHCFFETRKKIQLTIVKHVEANCLEIIAYDPLLGIEADRLYVNAFCLGSKLNERSVKDTVAIKAKSFYRKNGNRQPLNRNTLMAETTLNMSVSYVVSRLRIAPNTSVHDCAICLIPLPGDDIQSEPASASPSSSSSSSPTAALPTQPMLDFQYRIKPDEVRPYRIVRRNVKGSQSTKASFFVPRGTMSGVVSKNQSMVSTLLQTIEDVRNSTFECSDDDT